MPCLLQQLCDIVCACVDVVGAIGLNVLLLLVLLLLLRPSTRSRGSNADIVAHEPAFIVETVEDLGG